MNTKQDLLKIIDHYGLNNQLRKLNEEVYELIESIYTDDGEQTDYDHIVEEYADVQVVLNQIRYYFGMDERQISDIMQTKIDRTLQRMEAE